MTTGLHARRRFLLLIGAGICFGVCHPTSSQAANPTSDVLRLVPPGTRICLVARDLRTHIRAIEGSPFEKWLERSAIGKRLTDPSEMAKIRQLESFLHDQFGIGFDQILDDLIGDVVVLAYQPGPPGKPEDEAGVVLINARKPELLGRLIEKLNSFQQKSGEIKSVNRKDHRGQHYFERLKSNGDPEYYFFRDGILAFSGQERAIREVIEQDANPLDGKGRVAAGIAALGLTEHCLVCWFDPRGFDAELSIKANATKDDGEKAFLTQFAKIWSATHGFALYAQPGRGLELGMVARFDAEKLSNEVRTLILPNNKGAAIWGSIPEDALLAIGGQLNVPQLLGAFETFLPHEGKLGLQKAIEGGLAPVVGRDKLPAVLSGLGPDWAVWVTAPPKDAPTSLPEWTAALKLTDSQKNEMHVGRTVYQAVDFAAQMVRFAYNKDHSDQIELSEETKDGVTVKVFANEKKFPNGLRPSFGLNAGYLVVASSPEGVRRFKKPIAENSQFETPILRFSPRHLRNYLKEHREAIIKAAVQCSGKSKTAIETELSELVAILEAVDKVEVHHKVDDSKIRLSLLIEFVEPLTR
jgi:hypothetical protein